MTMDMSFLSFTEVGQMAPPGPAGETRLLNYYGLVKWRRSAGSKGEPPQSGPAPRPYNDRWAAPGPAQAVEPSPGRSRFFRHDPANFRRGEERGAIKNGVKSPRGEAKTGRRRLTIWPADRAAEVRTICFCPDGSGIVLPGARGVWSPANEVAFR